MVAGARCLRTRLQLLVVGVQPELARLVEGDAIRRGPLRSSGSVGPPSRRTASSRVTTSGASVSMNELTEKTALPAPATP